MLTNRYAPVLELTIGGTNVESDLAILTADFSITDQVQSIELELSNNADKYVALAPFDEIILNLDGADKFYGRVDSCFGGSEKAKAKILKVKGRHFGGSGLEDIVASLQFVNESPKDIVQGIIDSYMTLKGDDDSEISVISNTAPTEMTLTSRWQRKSHWRMLQELEEALGATEAEGGANEFFDFWLDPVKAGEFYFVNAGSLDSGITIPEKTETVKATRTLDGLTVKNDIWVWGNSKAGRIPHEMELTYLTGLVDTWTEGNAPDYELYGDPLATPLDHCEDDYTEDFVRVGSASVHIKGPIISGLEHEHLTWGLTFPKDGLGVVWPAQDPGGHFNAYNEVAMSETMGEIVGCQFWLRSDSAFNLYMRAIDAEGTTMLSGGYHYARTFIPSTPAAWKQLAFPFGPSAEWALASDDKPAPVFDWSDVEKIYWIAALDLGFIGTPEIWFDGLEFIKPLVANTYSTSDGVRKSKHVAKDNITSYAAAKMIADSILEQEGKAQVYWDFEELGRSDLPSGQTFTLGSALVLMREQRWSFSKGGGWQLTGKAWEQT